MQQSIKAGSKDENNIQRPAMIYIGINSNYSIILGHPIYFIYSEMHNAQKLMIAT